jgi:cysteinyl-tRNA synthetase
VAVDEYDKNNANDFVLWKVDEVTRGHQHEPTKGAGRPGWHLECSAMSMKYLGPTIDIHIGGVDLIFPHHENEIAQSEAATEKPFVRYFVHGEFITVDGQKMAKSVGNIYSVEDIEEQGIDPLAYRYFVLGGHYRSKMNFTWEALQGAAKALEGIRQLAYRPTEIEPETKKSILEQGMAALENDLDTPKLLAILHEANNYDLWLAFEPILGLGLKVPEVAVPDQIQALLDKREEARKAGDYLTADQHRAAIEKSGYLIEDTSSGARLIPKRPLDKS